MNQAHIESSGASRGSLKSYITGFILSLRRDIYRQGAVLLIAVTVYGLCSMLFGFSTSFVLSYLLGHVHELGARSLKVCALVDKPGARKIDVHPDWAAFSLSEPLPDRFLVGYGLGWQGRYRALPYVGTIPRPAADPVPDPAPIG